MADQETQRDRGWGERLAGGMLDTGQEVLKQAGDQMLRDAPKATRFVLQRIPEGPGFVYQMADIAAAKDKPRAIVGAIGGLAGGAAGGAIGSAGGPVGTGVGSVVGATAGQDLATGAYDAAADYYQAHKAQVDGTKRWIEDRTARLFGR